MAKIVQRRPTGSGDGKGKQTAKSLGVPSGKGDSSKIVRRRPQGGKPKSSK